MMQRIFPIAAGAMLGLLTSSVASLAQTAAPAATPVAETTGSTAAAPLPAGDGAAAPFAAAPYLDDEFEQPDMAALERWWERYQRSLRLEVASPAPVEAPR